MPRTGPVYTLPEAAFIPNTSIVSADMNSDLSDIANALTDSLARDGAGGMTAVLPLTTDGFTYTVDPNTGVHRTGGDTQAVECGGIDVVTFTTTGMSVAGTLAVSGAITSGGAALIPIGLGPLPWSGTAAPAKWLLCRGQSLLRASYPDLWTFAAAEIALGNTFFTNGNGSTTFTIGDMSGGAPFGSNNGTSRLTVANSGVNGDILGSTAGIPNPTILTANLPAYTPLGTITSSLLNNNIFGFLSGGSNVAVGGAVSGGTSQALFNNQGVTSAFTGTAQGGTSTPIKTQPRTVIVNFIIYAGV